MFEVSIPTTGAPYLAVDGYPYFDLLAIIRSIAIVGASNPDISGQEIADFLVAALENAQGQINDGRVLPVEEAMQNIRDAGFEKELEKLIELASNRDQ